MGRITVVLSDEVEDEFKGYLLKRLRWGFRGAQSSFVEVALRHVLERIKEDSEFEEKFWSQVMADKAERDKRQIRGLRGQSK